MSSGHAVGVHDEPDSVDETSLLLVVRVFVLQKLNVRTADVWGIRQFCLSASSSSWYLLFLLFVRLNYWSLVSDDVNLELFTGAKSLDWFSYGWISRR